MSSIKCTFAIFKELSKDNYYCTLCRCMLKKSHQHKHVEKKRHLKKLNYICIFLNEFFLCYVVVCSEKFRMYIIIDMFCSRNIPEKIVTFVRNNSSKRVS